MFSLSLNLSKKLNNQFVTDACEIYENFIPLEKQKAM